MTLLSRVSGMLRDMVYSQVFGAGPLMDAFFIAFKIPNFLRRLSGEGAFSQAFVPVVSEYRIRRSPDEVRELVNGVTGTFGVALFVITAIGVVAAPVIIFMFAPGFRAEGGRFDLAVDMLRWTFPYLFFISLVSLASGVLNSYGRFGAAAFTPVMLNVIMIVTAFLVAPSTPNPGVVLAMGVFVSGVIQLAFLWPFMVRLGVAGMPRWNWAHEGVRRVARLMLPGIFGSSVAQVSLLLDSLVASFLLTGSISWLYYADRLVEFPMGMFTIALATVVLPALSAHHASQSPQRFAATLDWSVRLVFLFVTPAAVGSAGSRRAAHRHDLWIRSIQRPRRRNGDVCTDGIFTRADRLQHGEGARARVLCPPGHAHAGSRRRDLSCRQHGVQRGHRAAGRQGRIPGAARTTRPVDRPFSVRQFSLAVSRLETCGRVSGRSRLVASRGPGTAREHRHGASCCGGSQGMSAAGSMPARSSGRCA